MKKNKKETEEKTKRPDALEGAVVDVVSAVGLQQHALVLLPPQADLAHRDQDAVLGLGLNIPAVVAKSNRANKSSASSSSSA